MYISTDLLVWHYAQFYRFTDVALMHISIDLLMWQ